MLSFFVLSSSFRYSLPPSEFIPRQKWRIKKKLFSLSLCCILFGGTTLQGFEPCKASKHYRFRLLFDFKKDFSFYFFCGKTCSGIQPE